MDEWEIFQGRGIKFSDMNKEEEIMKKRGLHKIPMRGYCRGENSESDI